MSLSPAAKLLIFIAPGVLSTDNYSHIRMEAKRRALESIVHNQPAKPAEPAQKDSPLPTVKQQIEGEYPQKSPQSVETGRICRGKKERKPLKRIGYSGRTRTMQASMECARY
jgi:hypothetical protein